jgi:Uma2 family endonuclease
MAVMDRPRAKADVLRERIEALRPGDVFSIDRPISVEEFCEYVSDEGSAELVNGVIFIMSPPTDAHEAVAIWLARVVGLYVELRGLGEVRAGRSGVRISRTSLREPDLLFFRKDRLDHMTGRGVHGAPDLAIEIVDSAKARREAVQKQAQYEEIGVTELWVIDLPRRELRQFLLDDGEFVRVQAERETEVTSRAVEGFRLRSECLFQGPTFPSSLEVVQNLLAGR